MASSVVIGGDVSRAWKLLVCLWIGICSSTVVYSQAAAPVLSERALAVRTRVQNFPDHASITVVLLDKEEEYGRLVSSGVDGFKMFDVDTKTEVQLRYEQVRKVKAGYGGYNSFTKRHTDRGRGILFTSIVLIGLGVLIGAAAAAK